MFRLLLLTILPLAANAASYTAQWVDEAGTRVVRLTDPAHAVEVSVLPSFGNRIYSMKVHGQNILYFPLPDASALKSSQPPAFNAIPFLAPWANRIAGAGFWADDKHYRFDPDIDTVRLDPHGIAIHGLVASSPLWEVTEVSADSNSAHVTSRLAFWRYPQLMANWPFAHEYELTYTLAGGVLEITTRVKNLSAAPMPITLGYHPYFVLPGSERSGATAHIPARQHVETDANLVATGQLTPSHLPAEASLRDRNFDDGFTDLVRDSDGLAVFSVTAGAKKIEVLYGPKYQVAVVYAPPRQNFICFEPMTAITNGINLAHDGKYPQLQTVSPGATWTESFWIRTAGL